MLALVDELTHSMADYAPEHMRPAHKSMMRIYRDIRFSPDKRPYKTHLSAWWSRRGMEKTSGGGFYIQIGPEDLFLAAGVYMPERDQLLALRRWMAENHRDYNTQLNKLLKPRSSRTPAMQPIDPEALTRVPKGFCSRAPRSRSAPLAQLGRPLHAARIPRTRARTRTRDHRALSSHGAARRHTQQRDSLRATSPRPNLFVASVPTPSSARSRYFTPRFPPKTAQFWVLSAENPKNTCGNRCFVIDKALANGRW